MTITYRASLGDVLDHRLDEAKQRIRQLDAAYLATTPQADIVDNEMQELGMEPLSFDFDDLSVLGGPTTAVESIRDEFQRTVRAEVTTYTFMIPFRGDPMLINHRPHGRMGGTSLGAPLQAATISGATVDLIIKTRGIDPTSVQQGIQSQLAYAKDWLARQADYANGYVKAWNEQARGDLLQAVVSRQRTLQTSTSVMEALGIPIGKSKAPVPVTPRPRPLRIAKVPAASSTATETEYVLEAALYDDIVQTITSLGNAAERLPITNQKLGEEDIRNIILFVLNANYEGQAVGEAFSGAGKTDILLMWKGRAAFVGECKIWHGEKKFLEAVDQLFSYTAWRDSRVALIVFADPSSMSDVQVKARAAIKKHPSFVQTTGDDRCLMTHPQDSAKHLTVSLLFVAATLKAA